MQSQLKDFLERYGPLDEKDLLLAVGFFREKSVKKGEYILKPGDICETANFVATGLLRLYENVNGKEFTRNIFREGSFFSESISYFLGIETRFYLEAIEDSTVLQITKKNSEIFFESSVAFSRIGRKIYEANLVALASRISGRVKGSGKERYLDFRRKNADLFQRMPQYMIASYLGLSPEALSRIISST